MSKSSNPIYRTADAVIRGGLRHLPVSDSTEKVALVWGFRYQPKPRVITLRSGLRFKYDTCDLIPLSLYYLGTFEEHCLSYARALAPEGSTVLDAGANIGLYTVELAGSVGPKGKVIAIEAIPQHAETVRANLALNRFSHAEIIQVAVGEETGEVSLGLPDCGNPGMFSVGAGNGSDSITVPLRSIDDLLAERGVQSLSLIKMDIEGYELNALKGASRSIAAFKPAILIELNDGALKRCGTSAAEVRGFLEQAGYTGWVISREGGRRISPNDTHGCDECLFLHRDHADRAAKLKLP